MPSKKLSGSCQPKICKEVRDEIKARNKKKPKFKKRDPNRPGEFEEKVERELELIRKQEEEKLRLKRLACIAKRQRKAVKKHMTHEEADFYEVYKDCVPFVKNPTKVGCWKIDLKLKAKQLKKEKELRKKMIKDCKKRKMEFEKRLKEIAKIREAKKIMKEEKKKELIKKYGYLYRDEIADEDDETEVCSSSKSEESITSSDVDEPSSEKKKRLECLPFK